MAEAKSDGPADPLRGHRIALSAVQAARQVIDPVFLNTPCYECEPLSTALGCRFILKLETANPIRSFKGRGASLLVRGLKPDRNSAPVTALVSASAGNWGQALAYACRDAGIPLILYAATNANSLKVARMRSLGADVRLAGSDFDAAKLEAEGFAREAGLRMVADGFDVEASIGAATIGFELAERGDYDSILVPLGNGALLAGIGRWTKAVAPTTEVVGVSATGADAMAASWRSGHLVTRERVETIADGIAVRVPIPEAVADMKGTVDDLLLVPDEAIVAAMRLLFAEAGLLIEPAGAAGVAAVLVYPERFKGKRVATVLCGGNLTGEQVRRWMT
jgi:threonine dehydratase